MSDRLNRFLGDTPGRTVLKLVAGSVIVGIIMSALQFTPLDLVYIVEDFFRWVYRLGFEAFERVGIYFLYGAMVVVPVFILLRIMAMGRKEP